ncbi:Alpha/Beta hydrolase protein [Xylariaceae sp. AK1471]|nr:Alpha/Beta hydrolase protein [Xylariaceae sp. AK1471]
MFEEIAQTGRVRVVGYALGTPSVRLGPSRFTTARSKGSWPDPPFTEIPQCRSISDYADSLLAKTLGPTPPGLQEKTLPAASGSNPGPLILLFHPGGFFLSSPAKLIMYACPLARLFGASVLCPSYRFAPEHPFPTTTHLGADPKRKGFLVGGISSGANFAVALTRRAVEKCLRPPVTGTWAPIFMGLSADGGGGEAQTMWEYYRPEITSSLFSPLATPLDSLTGMPKVVLQVAGHDLFRDDGLVLAHVLKDRGVEFVRDVVVGFAWLLDVKVETLETGWETAMAMPTIKVEESDN